MYSGTALNEATTPRINDKVTSFDGHRAPPKPISRHVIKPAEMIKKPGRLNAKVQFRQQKSNRWLISKSRLIITKKRVIRSRKVNLLLVTRNHDFYNPRI